MLVLKSSITKSLLSMTAITFFHSSIAYAKAADDSEKPIPKFKYEGQKQESDFTTRFGAFLQDAVKIPSVEAALAAGVPTQVKVMGFSAKKSHIACMITLLLFCC
jgi:hypothetical protein